jgi:Amt family ammonium transporter
MTELNRNKKIKRTTINENENENEQQKHSKMCQSSSRTNNNNNDKPYFKCRYERELSVVERESHATAALGDYDYMIMADGNALWLLLGAYLVFFMQSGFALLEAGCVRAKNTKNILLKNVLDACMGALIWWGFGWPLAYGSDQNEFIGGADYYGGFFMSDQEQADAGMYALWLFQWAFAATAATIVSGAVAERCSIPAYATYTVFLTGFVYPVAAHWGWSTGGWLSAFYLGDDGEYDPQTGGNGLIDFAGSGIVHMTGGGAALMGAIFLGPRTGRFAEDGTVNPMPGHSSVLAALGTMILWFGWYGFNPVSTLCLFGCMSIAMRVAVMTTLAAAAGGCTGLAMDVMMGNPPDIGPCLNGILGGLVAITAPCAVCDGYAAVFIGIIGAMIEYGSEKMLLKLKIDDVLSASPVHFFAGAWGVIASGLFATQANTSQAYGSSVDDYGAFYGGGGKQLGIQISGVLAFAAWTCGMSAIMFFALKAANVLRVSVADEATGLDESHHGGSAYPKATS